MIAVAVGPYSQQGIIFQLLAQKSDEESGTPSCLIVLHKCHDDCVCVCLLGFITQAIKKCVRKVRRIPDETEEQVEVRV